MWPFDQYEKPASPQASKAREFIKRNKSRLDDLTRLSDSELEQLMGEVDALVPQDQRWQMHTLESELFRTYFEARESIKAERVRREGDKFSAWLRRDRAKGAVIASLASLAGNATGNESIETVKELALSMDDVLGAEPPAVSKLTKAAAAKLSDEELDGAISEAYQQAHASALLVSDADDIQMAMDYLAPFVRELKRRQTLLESCRRQGEANHKVLSAEHSERKARREANAARLRDVTLNSPEVIAQILDRLDSIEGAS